jgi:hypothetical protein
MSENVLEFTIETERIFAYYWVYTTNTNVLSVFSEV